MKYTSISSTFVRRIALCGLALSAVSVQAATILSTNATWPVAPAVETVDVLTEKSISVGASLPSGAGTRGLSGTRQLRQTFQVGTAFTLEQIFLSVVNYNDFAFTVKFFEVADVEATTWAAGTQVGSTITVGAFGSAASGARNISIGLTALGEITFAVRNSGQQGYGMELESADGVSNAFGWAQTNDGTDYAPKSRFYRETGTGQSLTLDAGFALAIPEPSTALLGGLGALLLLRRRRI